jgi:hypothetical protein
MGNDQGEDGKHSGPGQGGGDNGGNSGPGHDVKIRIDREDFNVREDVLTGAELRRLPNPDIGPERDLFEVVPGGSDKKIELTDRVKMRDGLRFFTAPAQINPGRG